MLERNKEDAEVELIDILNVFVKRKKLIILGTAIITAFAIIFSFILPKTYKISAIIEPGKRPITDQNGQIVEEKYIESSISIRETILGGAYDEFLSKKLNIAENEIPRISVTVPQKTELIDISIKSKNPELALHIVTELLNRISTDLQRKIFLEKYKVDSEINISEIEYKSAIDQIKNLEKQMAETKSKIIELEADRKKAISLHPDDAMVVLLYSNEIQNGQIYLNDLLDKVKEHEMQSKKSLAKVENLKNKLSMIKTAEVYKSPYMPNKPIGPRKDIIIVAAFVLGFFLMTMTAFLLEYLRTKKMKH